MYDYGTIYKKIIHLRKGPDESLEDFHDYLMHFYYFYEDDIDWNFMKEKFEYVVHISLNPSEYESLESIPTYTGYGALKYTMK